MAARTRCALQPCTLATVYTSNRHRRVYHTLSRISKHRGHLKNCFLLTKTEGSYCCLMADRKDWSTRFVYWVSHQHCERYHSSILSNFQCVPTMLQWLSWGCIPFCLFLLLWYDTSRVAIWISSWSSLTSIPKTSKRSTLFLFLKWDPHTLRSAHPAVLGEYSNVLLTHSWMLFLHVCILIIM